MFSFTDSERIYLKEMSAITIDSEGREVLCGLTFEETAVYMAHSRAFLSAERDRENRYTYLSLREKHERARSEIIGTEHYIKTENPSIQ